jgi:hypothetical protein
MVKKAVTNTPTVSKYTISKGIWYLTSLGSYGSIHNAAIFDSIELAKRHLIVRGLSLKDHNIYTLPIEKE